MIKSRKNIISIIQFAQMVDILYVEKRFVNMVAKPYSHCRVR